MKNLVFRPLSGESFRKCNPLAQSTAREPPSFPSPFGESFRKLTRKKVPLWLKFLAFSVPFRGII